MAGGRGANAGHVRPSKEITMLTHPVPTLEPEAVAFAAAAAEPPFLFQLPVEEGRATLDSIQSGPVTRPDVDLEDLVLSIGPTRSLPVRILRPVGTTTAVPVLLYVHGAGWVFGSPTSHDRLVRELAAGAGIAVAFPHYDRAPEAPYPRALEQCHALAVWLTEHGAEHGLDASRMAIGGDSAGGNLAIATTIVAKRRGGPMFAAQLLFYPVTDAGFDTGSYRDFAEGYFLRRDGMQWFWDQYVPDHGQRAEITVSPRRATPEDLAGLPPALIITAEADVLRDEGEAYAAQLRSAGVPVVATRYSGIIHDFVMLDALRSTDAAGAAIAQAQTYLRDALRSEP
jgi:acetyl esterase/lipase